MLPLAIVLVGICWLRSSGGPKADLERQLRSLKAERTKAARLALDEHWNDIRWEKDDSRLDWLLGHTWMNAACQHWKSV